MNPFAYTFGIEEEYFLAQAGDGRLVLFGIPPTRPETGYGYIQATTKSGASKVVRFHEKPDADTARRFLDQGGFFWNSGMFVWRWCWARCSAGTASST